MSGVSKSKPTPRKRDVRLDFFRGIGMFIIFISHMPGNTWAGFIPARFGFSDATEIFVFCSGMASAIAFGAVFQKQSFWLGTARVAHRCWQVYWAHVAAFFAITAILIGFDTWLDVGNKYISQLNLLHFTEGNTAQNLLGFLTLTYVPNYFDILPMYLVILAMMPIVMALSKINLWAVFAFIAGVYLFATLGYGQFPAEPWTDRKWFFHPLAWQLVFFTGFAFIMRWLPAPPIERGLVLIALAIVILSVPFKYWPLYKTLDPDMTYRTWIQMGMNKTQFSIVRYVHFLALAYLAYAAAGEAGKRLSQGWFVDICRKVGQQALAVFLVGLLLSRLGGIAMDYWGDGFFVIAALNLGGCALLYFTAVLVGWFKSSPWSKRRLSKDDKPAPSRVGISTDVPAKAAG